MALAQASFPNPSYDSGKQNYTLQLLSHATTRWKAEGAIQNSRLTTEIWSVTLMHYQAKYLLPGSDVYFSLPLIHDKKTRNYFFPQVLSSNYFILTCNYPEIMYKGSSSSIWKGNKANNYFLHFNNLLSTTKVLIVSPEGFFFLACFSNRQSRITAPSFSGLAEGNVGSAGREVTQWAAIRAAVFLPWNGTCSSGFRLQSPRSTYAFGPEPCLRFLPSESIKCHPHGSSGHLKGVGSWSTTSALVQPPLPYSAFRCCYHVPHCDLPTALLTHQIDLKQLAAPKDSAAAERWVHSVPHCFISECPQTQQRN